MTRQAAFGDFLGSAHHMLAAQPARPPPGREDVQEVSRSLLRVVTILGRYLHDATVDSDLPRRAPAPGIVEALAGLRFVRNQIGRGAPLGETIGTGAGGRRITGWTWKPIGEPDLAGLPPRAQAWELAQYRAYQTRLAGHTIGEIFGRAVMFLTLTGGNAASSAATSQPATRS